MNVYALMGIYEVLSINRFSCLHESLTWLVLSIIYV